MREGAIDFSTKPVHAAMLLGSIVKALQCDRANRQEAIAYETLCARYAIFS
jgi:FixJ family two-component response regulator